MMFVIIGLGNSLAPLDIIWGDVDLLSFSSLGYYNFSMMIYLKHNHFLHRRNIENTICKMGTISFRSKYDKGHHMVK